MTLRLALVGGPMYDALYSVFDDEDVEIVVRADHPTLNREIARRLAVGERLDLISTHGKYTPSQRQWLHALDDLVPQTVLDDLAPPAVALCRFHGELLCAPRNIDVRVLWWRTDQLEGPPMTWDDVIAAPAPFGFTGRESGLFGLFFEVITAAGGAPFALDGTPTLEGADAVAAIERIVAMASAAPPEMAHWHYDEVDEALVDGRVAMAAAWPGGTGRIRESDLGPRLRPAMYPGGRSYSGCHGWAIPQTCADLDAATALLLRLVGAEAGGLDATAGTIPANVRALAGYVPTDDVDAERLAITRRTIDGAMLTYPPLARFPEVEDAAWEAIHDAILGEITPKDAAVRMQAAAEAALGSGA